MKPFAYHQPNQIPDAAKLLTSIEDSKLVAGGMTLIPTLKQRLASPVALVDLSKLPNLKGITDDGATITIGAMTPHAVVAASKLVPDDIVQMITASGTPDECRAKVAEYVAAGCTCPILYPLGDDVRLMIDTFAGWQS